MQQVHVFKIKRIISQIFKKIYTMAQQLKTATQLDLKTANSTFFSFVYDNKPLHKICC